MRCPTAARRTARAGSRARGRGRWCSGPDSRSSILLRVGGRRPSRSVRRRPRPPRAARRGASGRRRRPGRADQAPRLVPGRSARASRTGLLEANCRQGRRALRVELERVLAGARGLRVVAVQRPVARVDGQLLVLSSPSSCRCRARCSGCTRSRATGRGWASASASAFTVCGVVGAHRDLRDVDVAVGRRDHAEVLLARRLPPRRTSPPRRAASPSTPGRPCSSRPRCRARGC